jgi:FMN phosphatase YigB (HAD superfamily)
MWHTADRQWVVHTPRFASDDLDPDHAAGPWFGHRFFAYDLIRWGRPECIVELGTHYGVSFFAFCQAVRDEGLRTAVHAIDTWQGDPHAGEYGDEVLEVVERIRGQVFPGVDARLHRTFFRDALPEFEDGSIDLMHIDGYHSYDAVKEDYESWLPKLADGSVVFFHDVAAWSGYGSAQFWQDLRREHPSLTYDHSFGLGVLFPKGAEQFEYLLGEEFGRWHSYYEARARAFLGELQFRDQAAMIDARDQYIGVLEREVAGLGEQVEREHQEVIELRAAAVEHKVAESPPTPAAPPVSDARRLLRRVARLLRRGARASNRHLGTSLRIGAETPAEIDLRIAAVFDADFYLERNPDVALAAVDPLDHYCRRGWIEGRDPNPLFWTEWYLHRYRDVAAAAVEPLRYHLETGWRAGHDPSPLLRTRWYLDRHPDLRAANRSPLEHYWTEGFEGSAYANPEQRRRLVAAPPPAHAIRRHVVECELLAPGQAARLVTLDALARADVDLVTFDLWDTLVSRSRPADAPKLATARRIFLTQGSRLEPSITPWDLFAQRVETEAQIAHGSTHEEYRLEDVLTQHLSAVLRSSTRQAKPLAAQLAAEEAAEEARRTYRIDELADTLEQLRARPNGPRVAVLSDFYLGGDALRAIAEAAGIDVDGVDVLVSCDVDASKRLGGTLFELARARAGVEPARHLHIGDNPWSDGEQHVALGGSAALVRLSPSPFPGPGELDPSHLRVLIDEMRDELLCVVDVLAAGVGTGRGAVGSDTERRAAHAGVLTSFLPVLLVAAAVEDAVARGVSTVHYVSREGAFLRQLHDLIAPILVGSAGPAPAARHLEVSRRSTFGASIGRCDRESLALMWSQYADQSPRTLFESLGVDITPLEPILTACGLGLDELVPDAANDERIAELISHPEVGAHVERILADRRRALEAYLRQEMDLSTPEVIVVDVGWRGTIQDNLARVLPDVRWHGCYLGLFPFLNPQPANVTKRAIAFDGNEGDPFVHVSPPAAVEAPLTPDRPSPVGYLVRDDHVTVVHEHEGPRTTAEIDAFQEGVLAAAPRVAEWLVVNGLTSTMLRRELGELVSEYYGRPEGGVADIWFGSTHDDTFGAANVSPFEKAPPPRSVLTHITAADAAPAEAHRSNWVPGYRAWLPVRALEVLREMWRELH